MAGRAVDADRAAVGVDDLAGDEQAQASAAGGCVWAADVLVEDRRLLGRGDAGAVVADVDAQDAVSGRGADGDRAAGRGVAD